jgi:hypothetical protein
MEHAEIELFLGRQMPHTREERLPERPITSPFRQDFVDGRGMHGRFAVAICGYGQALPLPPRREHPEEEGKDTMIAQFALRSTFGHRKVRADKYRELSFGEVDRNRRRCRLCGCRAPQARASCEA